ncbi:hypothetical protein Cni_G09727 [Canna indica]|uniref:Uncharacterized protein n=1 Tax=Canna indica TaxID=4628 RepID=A0AAQ3K2W0_9LILI|nr:hypothetical protein Cni_G09727 [Canna indica]
MVGLSNITFSNMEGLRARIESLLTSSELRKKGRGFACGELGIEDPSSPMPVPPPPPQTAQTCSPSAFDPPRHLRPKPRFYYPYIDSERQCIYAQFRFLVMSMQSVCLQGLGGEKEVEPRL